MTKTTVQFGRSTYVEAVADLADIVAKVKEAKGTVSVRKTLATWEALGQVVDFDKSSPDYEILLRENATLGDIAGWIEQVNQWAEQLADEHVTGILKASTTDTATLDTLKASYADKRKLVDAMGMMLTQIGIDVTDVEVPAMKVTTSSSGPRTVKTSGMTFYRIKDGTRIPQSDQQDKLSSMAYYYGAKITGTDKEAWSANPNKTADLIKWLTDNGVDSTTKPWAVTVNGVTYGMDIIEKS